ncbi:MAG: hypothetical protein JWR80_4738 [Bradyrhizobium sp.]|nr:hypothetical protein [Bradyrhizobium sp.]
MPKFVTIGYGDEAGYQRTDEGVRSDAHAHDAKLQEAGVEMGVAGEPVQVRNHQGTGIRITKGPFMGSALPVAGFSVFEAADMEQAIDMVSKTPCAIAYGVVEVWPLKETY